MLLAMQKSLELDLNANLTDVVPAQAGIHSTREQC